MLKCLAILAIFGAFLFGRPEAPKNQQSTSRAKQNYSGDSEKMAPPTNGVTYAKNCCTTETTSKKDDPEEKSLPRLERPEWVIVYITAIYVFISAWMLIAIKTQAGQMEAQTAILRESVAAAQKAANAANAQIQLIKDKERGRLRIEFGKPDLVNDPDPDKGYELPFSVTLDGATQVYITESSCFVGIHKSGDPVGEPWWNSMALPKTITPEDRIYKGYVTILTNETPWGEPFTGTDETRIALVREEKLHIFTRGVITYGDLFGNEWELRFNSRWNYCWEFPPTSIDLTSGYWESIGDNGEYKAESERPKPN